MAVNLKRSEALKIEQKSDSSKLFKWVLAGLVIAAVLELILWRTFTRIGVFIPKKSTFEAIYGVLSQVGRVMLNFAVILAVTMIGLIVGGLREKGAFRRGQVGAGRLMLATVAIILVLGLTFLEMALTYDPTVSLALRLSLLVGFMALSADYWQTHREWQARLFVGLMLGAYSLQILSKIIQDTFVGQFGLHSLLDTVTPVQILGEGLVLANGVVLLGVYAGNLRKPNLLALVGALALAGALVGLTLLTVDGSDIVPILGLYTLGYTMQLPLAFYVIGLFGLAYCVFFNLGHLQIASQRAAAFGLILIFTGGYVFNISNQYLFALIGLVLLTRTELLENF